MASREASRCQFLRLALQLFSAPRNVSLGGAVAGPTRSLTAILAGSGLATDILLLIMVKPVEDIIARWLGVRAGLLVDDLSLLTLGRENEVASDIVNITKDATQSLCEAGFLVSTGSFWKLGGKTVVTTSTKKTLQKASLACKAAGLKCQVHAKHLGIDFDPSREGKKQEAWRQRKNDTREKKRRIIKLAGKKKLVASRLARSSLASSLAYGAEVVGNTDAQLKTIDGDVADILGERIGRSRFARLFVTEGLPSARAAVAPIAALARAYFDETLPADILADAWLSGVRRVAAKPGTQVASLGPVEAAIRAAIRVGWKVPGPGWLLDGEGRKINLRSESPRAIEDEAKHAYQRAAARRSTLAKTIGGEPFLEPLRAFLRQKKIDGSTKASLVAMGEGAWVTQADLFASGRAQTAQCQACSLAKGTFLHRVSACEASRLAREKAKGAEKGALERAQKATALSDTLYTRGVPTRPEARQRAKPTIENEERWLVLPAARQQGCEGILKGNLGTDGSMTAAEPRDARRMGYSVVMADDAGDVLIAVYGCYFGLAPSAFRAELFGLTRVVELVAFEEVLIYIDCSSVVGKFNKGPLFSTHGRAKGADLWRRIFEAVGGSAKVVWTKGHVTKVDLQRGVATSWCKKVNDHCDLFAKRGAALAQAKWPNDHLTDRHREAMQFYAWLARFAQNWPEKSDTQTIDRDKEPKQIGKRKLDDRWPHRIWKNAKGWACSLCRRTAETRWPEWGKNPCSGAAVFLEEALAKRAALEIEEEWAERGAKRTWQEALGSESGGVAPSLSSGGPGAPTQDTPSIDWQEAPSFESGGVAPSLSSGSGGPGASTQEFANAALFGGERHLLRQEGGAADETEEEEQARTELNAEALDVPQRAARRRLTRKTAIKREHETQAGVMVAKLLGTGWRKKVHASHSLLVSGAAVFCGRCGRFATESARERRLRKPCGGEVGDVTAGWVCKQIALLKAGRVPGHAARTAKHRKEELHRIPSENSREQT